MDRIRESGEMYLETILLLSQKKGNVRSVDIVNKLGYSKSSVSKGVNTLKAMGYIRFDENECIHFTESGRRKAEETYERHCTLTELLVKMGVSRERAEEDACRMEHVISEETFSAIKDYLKKI